eukprot:m.164530 g.164530  ORF g.164530 m.164530 type:complete len:259 (+) comp16410_c4_seq1:157-933(+)
MMADKIASVVSLCRQRGGIIQVVFFEHSLLYPGSPGSFRAVCEVTGQDERLICRLSKAEDDATIEGVAFDAEINEIKDAFCFSNMCDAVERAAAEKLRFKDGLSSLFRELLDARAFIIIVSHGISTVLQHAFVKHLGPELASQIFIFANSFLPGFKDFSGSEMRHLKGFLHRRVTDSTDLLPKLEQSARRTLWHVIVVIRRQYEAEMCDSMVLGERQLADLNLSCPRCQTSPSERDTTVDNLRQALNPISAVPEETAA